MLMVFPKSELVLTHLFIAIKQQNRREEAFLLAKDLIKNLPTHAKFQNFLGHEYLRKGQFKDANPHYNYRFQLKKYLSYNFQLQQPEWGGQVLQLNQTLLVIGEQGLGDKINFVRFISVLEKYATKIIFLVHQELGELFKTLSSDKTQIIINPKTLPEHDFFVPLASVPGKLGFNNFEDISGIPIPVLNAEKRIS